MKDYEEKYENFWKEIVETDGKIDIDKVKRELFDYGEMICNVSKVYCHITESRISKPLTSSEAVIEVHDDIRIKDIEEAIKDYNKEYEDESKF